MGIFGALSPHPKIPFPAGAFEREFLQHCTRRLVLLRRLIRVFLVVPRLFRIESERRKLPAPFGRRIAEPLDADATGQAAFYRRFDEIWCEEGERDRHVDLPNAALLASAKFGDVGYSTRDHVI
jgi:hypothetical protein